MTRLREDAWETIPTTELGDFRYWPFNEVTLVCVETVMRRNHNSFYEEFEEMVQDLSAAGMRQRKGKPFLFKGYAQVPQTIKGNWAVGTPITFKIYTPKREFYLFRYCDWYWRLNWMMPSEDWKRFEPEPAIRHNVVDRFIQECKDHVIYAPHKDETREFPKTWGTKDVPDDVAFLGERDIRWLDGGIDKFTRILLPKARALPRYK